MSVQYAGRAMTSDLSKITSGWGPSAARLQLLIDRAVELLRGMATMPPPEREVVLAELDTLFAQMSKAARDTADGFEALVARSANR